MIPVSNQWRRVAGKIVRHAAWVLPGAESGWAEAMRRELDYIEDDRAALHWAIGCVLASYAERLLALRRWRWRATSGAVVAGSMLLLVAMVLQVHASDRAFSAQQRRCHERYPTGALPVHARDATGCGAVDERKTDERID